MANAFFADKIRLAIIMILCLKSVDEMDEYLKLLEQSHQDEVEQQTLAKIRKMAAKKKVSNQQHLISIEYLERAREVERNVFYSKGPRDWNQITHRFRQSNECLCSGGPANCDAHPVQVQA